MSLFDKLHAHLRKARIRISIPFISYEATIGELADSRSIDERITQLERVREDLLGAVSAVEELQGKALETKKQYLELEHTIKTLQDQKATTEALLKIPEESFSRVFVKASSRGRWRGLIEGAFIGFATGCLSSALVWYLTK